MLKYKILRGNPDTVEKLVTLYRKEGYILHGGPIVLQQSVAVDTSGWDAIIGQAVVKHIFGTFNNKKEKENA